MRSLLKENLETIAAGRKRRRESKQASKQCLPLGSLMSFLTAAIAADGSRKKQMLRKKEAGERGDS
jgi:hypothetical protein